MHFFTKKILRYYSLREIFHIISSSAEIFFHNLDLDLYVVFTLQFQVPSFFFLLNLSTSETLIYYAVIIPPFDSNHVVITDVLTVLFSTSLRLSIGDLHIRVMKLSASSNRNYRRAKRIRTVTPLLMASVPRIRILPVSNYFP